MWVLRGSIPTSVIQIQILSHVLCISASDIQPDFSALVEAQQGLDFSHGTEKQKEVICIVIHNRHTQKYIGTFSTCIIRLSDHQRVGLTVNYSVAERSTKEKKMSAYLFVCFIICCSVWVIMNANVQGNE